MSNSTNVNILETAAELIDMLDGSEMANKLEQAVQENDLEQVYYLNTSIMAAMAHEVMQ